MWFSSLGLSSGRDGRFVNLRNFVSKFTYEKFMNKNEEPANRSGPDISCMTVLEHKCKKHPTNVLGLVGRKR